MLGGFLPSRRLMHVSEHVLGRLGVVDAISVCLLLNADKPTASGGRALV